MPPFPVAISAIVLAAGLSQRMGKMNKLLLPCKNGTVLSTTIENILTSGIKELIVVTGYEADLVKEAIKRLPVKIIYNPDYEKGKTTSIQQGVRLATGEGYMICLADMVRITPSEYGLLRYAFVKQLQLNIKCICLPVFKKDIGNPVIFSSYYKEMIIQHKEMEGCKGIVQLHQENVCTVQMDANHVLEDMDSPDDYRKLPK